MLSEKRVHPATATVTRTLHLSRCLFAVLVATSLFGRTATVIGVVGAQYTVTEIPILGGYPNGQAAGINSKGDVAGWSPPPGSSDHAILYSNGQVTDLGTLGGYSYGYAINDSGLIAGSTGVTGTTNQHACLFNNGTIIDLGTLPGHTDSYAEAINNRGQVVGMSYPSSGSGHGFLYSNGHMIDLGSFGGPNCVARAINDNGLVAGVAGYSNHVSHAFLFDGVTLRDIGTLGGTQSIAWGINDAADVVGESYTAGDSANHAFVYTAKGMKDLGTLGGNWSRAYDINNYGDVVGDAYTGAGVPHAFIYRNGVMTDLNSLIDSTSGVTLGDGAAINENGQIICNGYNLQGNARGFVLTPIPEPGALTLSIFGLGLLARRVRRSKA